MGLLWFLFCILLRLKKEWASARVWCHGVVEKIISSVSCLLRLAVPSCGRYWYPLAPHGFYIESWLLTCKHERLFPWLFSTVPSKIFSGCFAEAIESWWWELVQLPLSWGKELLWLQQQVWWHSHLSVRVFGIFLAVNAVVNKPGSTWLAAFRGWNLVFSVRKTWDCGAIQEN